MAIVNNDVTQMLKLVPRLRHHHGHLVFHWFSHIDCYGVATNEAYCVVYFTVTVELNWTYTYNVSL